MPTLTDAFATLADPAARFVVPSVTGLADDDLLAGARVLGEINRRVDATSAVFAAEIARRSTRDLGHDGLAQRRGARSPEILVQQFTGSSAREAVALVRVGTMMATDAMAASGPELTPAVDTAPWLHAVAVAVGDGRLSIEAADAIRAGLGTLESAADPAALGAGLTEAAAILLGESQSLPVERLAARARALRDELDVAGVRQREEERREKRFLHLTPQDDGMTRLSGLLDPESAAVVGAAFDAATSPRRGGPRFVDEKARRRADELVADERTTGQIALDTFVTLIQMGTDADDGTVLGTRRPAVRLLVTERDMRDREGMAWIEGQDDAVSLETAERHACGAGILPILFDTDGHVVNIGRAQRFHTPRQRAAIGARDGGCIVDGCDKPPSWSEVHHPEEWLRDDGETSVPNGVLLCRFHHRWVHNGGWKVMRRGIDYLLVPPASNDPERRPIPTRAKSAVFRRMMSGQGA
jgi:hypothetical protein